MGLRREVWFGSQPNNLRQQGWWSPQESVKKGERWGPQGTKTFKGHRGKRSSCDRRKGEPERTEEKGAVEQNVSVEMVPQCQIVQGSGMEWTGNCGIWQQDVCLGSVAAGLRGRGEMDVEVREWGRPHVFQGSLVLRGRKDKTVGGSGVILLSTRS